MGIPGLAKKAREHLKRHGPRYYKGGDFYLDGLNFLHGVSDKVEGHKKSAPYTEFIRRLRQRIKMLRKFSPHSITLVIDAICPTKKFPIRVKRHTARLGRLVPRQCIGSNMLMVAYILENDSDIQIVYSGSEAEDEIMKYIDENSSHRRRQFVFSDDSDIFCFDIHNSSNVEVVPLSGQTLIPSQMSTINLGEVLKSGAVPKSLIRKPPIPRLGETITNVQKPERSCLEFINSGRVYHKFQDCCGPLYSPSTLAAPYIAGVDLRRAAYGIMIEKGQFKDPQDIQVEEWAQNDGKMELSLRRPILGQNLELIRQIVNTVPIPVIICEQLEEIQDQVQISSQEIQAIGLYLRDLIQGKGMELVELSPNAIKLSTLLKAVLVSLSRFIVADGGQRNDYNLVWHVTPWELSNYLG